MSEPAVPVPAATILMLRDGPTGLETFMVDRHHQIDFASGALVFPGGKVDDGDFKVRDLCDGVDASQWLRSVWARLRHRERKRCPQVDVG